MTRISGFPSRYRCRLKAALLAMAVVVSACGAVAEPVTTAGSAQQPSAPDGAISAPDQDEAQFAPPTIDPTTDALTQCGTLAGDTADVRTAELTTALDLGAAIGLYWQAGAPGTETRTAVDAARIGLAPILSYELQIDEPIVICQLEGDFAAPSPPEFNPGDTPFALYGIRSTGDFFVTVITTEPVVSAKGAGPAFESIRAAVSDLHAEELERILQPAEPQIDGVDGE